MGGSKIMEEGDLAPFMAGFDYVLVESEFAEYIEMLDLPRLGIIDAVIYDPRQKKEYRIHKQLKIDQHFSSLYRFDRG
jgi:hypothetical protein